MAKIKTHIDLPSMAGFDAMLDESLRVTEHFDIGELANTSAADDTLLVLSMENLTFLLALEELRKILVDAKYISYFSVNSFYRTKNFNTEHGGASNSSHLKGLAVDNDIRKGYRVEVSDSVRLIISSIWQYICKHYGRVGYVCWYTHGFHFDFCKSGSFKVYDYRKTAKDW